MSKKLLSLFLAVVMLALAIPAAVLPAFAAEEAESASTGIVTSSWDGTVRVTTTPIFI